MKKIFLVLIVALFLIGGSVVIFATSNESSSDESKGEIKEETTEKEKGHGVSPIKGWSMSKFKEVENHFYGDADEYGFGEIETIEDVNREIIQMTSQKIESVKTRELLGGDAPTFPFTPVYPSGLGLFESTNNYAALTMDNLEYLQYVVSKLDLDKEINERYQGFLSEWKRRDFSNLIEVHKDLLHEYANPMDGTEQYLEVDDYRLATKEEEEAFLRHYGIGPQYQ
ncbi:hypothetical protein OPHB3_3430 [Oceanobacillus picturae]|uniref:YARHG domain-containing protein n=1 Tax=Oceanobacillus picturae TaxID=171693 RepID=A0A0U9H9S8_9BACI|nr:DUF6241 domain-containing protein [Oceanobacillus picturae]GAQ19461.1 hypothetical protein OPHB3_3430 [Oceanobacillus picturae]